MLLQRRGQGQRRWYWERAFHASVWHPRKSDLEGEPRLVRAWCYSFLDGPVGDCYGPDDAA